MTNVTLNAKTKADSHAKLEELATRSNLMEEIADACEEHGEWNLAAIANAECEEIGQLRRALINTHIKLWG